jgi:SWI/SNF-related matrix-associated actin-dependent regulator 1 of chromatin subfamily A
VAAMMRWIDQCKAENKRMLLFSQVRLLHTLPKSQADRQFTMVLDILQVALKHLGVKFTRLDGQTKTDERQGLVDEFNDDEEITVFLLSTKAGGVGINLTAASVVIIYDQDFNPHNDRQAADRAYRIGQEKKVEVIKLITKDSIDVRFLPLQNSKQIADRNQEDMLNIGLTKLKLDDAVGGEGASLEDTGKEDQTAKEVRKSLITTLRNKFENGPVKMEVKGEAEEEVKEEEVGKTPVKIARAAGVKQEAKEETK